MPAPGSARSPRGDIAIAIQLLNQAYAILDLNGLSLSYSLTRKESHAEAIIAAIEDARTEQPANAA